MITVVYKFVHEYFMFVRFDHEFDSFVSKFVHEILSSKICFSKENSYQMGWFLLVSRFVLKRNERKFLMNECSNATLVLMCLPRLFKPYS